MILKKEQHERMPVLFIGHGSPMNAIEKNEFSSAWRDLAKKIRKPKAILCISAHWVENYTAVTAMDKPRTIHDFYGFPEKLYEQQYAANGSKTLAERIISLVKSVSVKADYEWGLDHGTWSVLINMYPERDIPVIQLSLDETLPLKKHVEIGKELAKLREEDVLIIGSGNIVHNLMMANMKPNAEAYPWAVEFDFFVKECLEKKDSKPLINYELHKFSKYAIPTNEHYLPLLYVLGASEEENPEFFCEKIFYSSLSMRCVMFR